MNNQTNNENLSQGTNGQPDEYSAYRDEEYERMRIEMENDVPKGVQENTGVL